MTLEIELYLAAAAIILTAYLVSALIERPDYRGRFPKAGLVSALLGTASAVLFLVILLHGGAGVALLYLVTYILNLRWLTSKTFQNANR